MEIDLARPETLFQALNGPQRIILCCSRPPQTDPTCCISLRSGELASHPANIFLFSEIIDQTSSMGPNIVMD